MNILGLIVEYNPFHNGHLYHIEEAKRKSNAEVVIAVMSGQFLQRGEPAIIDKFTRAKTAVDHGVDLVIELPVILGVQHRDLFCHAAVSILNKLGVNVIIFGSESGEITPFIKHVEAIEQHQEAIDHLLKEKLAEGLGYPEAYSKTLDALHLSVIDQSQPNNSLGLGYVKAVKKINPSITIDTFRRKQAHYHDETFTTPIASATSIRHQLASATIEENNQLAMPGSSFAALLNYQEIHGHFHTLSLYEPYIRYRITSSSLSDLSEIDGMDEGLEHRLLKQVKKSDNMTDFINHMTTKRYTTSRIKRLLIHLLLNIKKHETKKAIEQLPQLNAFRSLGQSLAGEKYIKQLKKQTEISIFTQLKASDSSIYRFDLRASSIYYQPVSPGLIKKEIMAPYRKPD